MLMTKTQIDPVKNGLPRLRLISPWAFWNTVVFGIFNIVIGISFVLEIDTDRITAPLIIVNEVLTYPFWGMAFIALGVAQFLFLHENKWDYIRWSHRVGTAIKATWAIALIIRVLTQPGTVLLTSVWMALMLLQIVTFIFIPTPKVLTKEVRNVDAK